MQEWKRAYYKRLFDRTGTPYYDDGVVVRKAEIVKNIPPGGRRSPVLIEGNKITPDPDPAPKEDFIETVRVFCQNPANTFSEIYEPIVPGRAEKICN